MQGRISVSRILCEILCAICSVFLRICTGFRQTVFVLTCSKGFHEFPTEVAEVLKWCSLIL